MAGASCETVSKQERGEEASPLKASRKTRQVGSAAEKEKAREYTHANVVG